MDVDAVVFDVFGTLTDWRGSVAEELGRVGRGVEADWFAVTDAWRHGYRPVLGRVLSGELPWQSLDALHRITLDEVLDGFGIGSGFGEDERRELVLAWHRLRAWDDVPEGLEALREKKITATLSNGGVGLLTRLAKHAGMRFDAILSAELARSYKPDPKVYLTAAALLDVEPGRLLMVACHPDDLEAAARAGLRTAYLPRPEWGPDAPPVPPPAVADLVVNDVAELAKVLG